VLGASTQALLSPRREHDGQDNNEHDDSDNTAEDDPHLNVLPEVLASDARCCRFELPAYHLEVFCRRAVAKRAEKAETRERKQIVYNMCAKQLITNHSNSQKRNHKKQQDKGEL
jgi:hypothetical protein